MFQTSRCSRVLDFQIVDGLTDNVDAKFRVESILGQRTVRFSLQQ